MNNTMTVRIQQVEAFVEGRQEEAATLVVEEVVENVGQDLQHQPIEAPAFLEESEKEEATLAVGELLVAKLRQDMLHNFQEGVGVEVVLEQEVEEVSLDICPSQITLHLRNSKKQYSVLHQRRKNSSSDSDF